MNLVLLPSRFYTRPRPKPLRYIVLHTTEGTDSRNELTQVGRASAQYLIRVEATYLLVDESDAAWHAGIVTTPTTPLYLGGNPSHESIGIEMEGFAAQAVDPRIIQATADLIRYIRARHGSLPIVSHSELSPGRRTDPGVQNRAAVETALKEENDMTPEDRAKLDRVLAIAEALLAQESGNAELVWTARTQRSLDVERGTVFDPTVPPLDPRIKVG